jgi:hypothetical protein
LRFALYHSIVLPDVWEVLQQTQYTVIVGNQLTSQTVLGHPLIEAVTELFDQMPEKDTIFTNKILQILLHPLIQDAKL